MKNFLNNTLGPIIIIVAILGTFGLTIYQGITRTQAQQSQQSFGLSVCTVTTTLLSIGHQAPTTVLSAGARSWAVIQQPLNATNTVAVSLGGTAAVGTGYELGNATTSNAVSELRVGYATNLPFQGAISARTSTGSTTLKVIECK